ncbi:hypothetical protein B296_00016925 [Ensete ventricosum]|uniref:non-specific serine/threonine protein kinase n=1 Tax=Ensete ventricosum TaxID=4639 RepID=A0A427B5F1_ENSVE|nr:hypothetical protein B296_00016925 [Ensete ventricosum]
MEDIRTMYSIGKELGRGQFGVTHRCTHKATGEELACKTIAKRKLRTKEDIEDVRREVQIMYHLSGQPNIVELKGAYEDKHSVHLVMELCAGGELFDRIIARGHYTERAAAALLRTIVQVVHTCHSMGVIHRDLKPENFLLLNEDEDAPLKATDFGLSVFFKEGPVVYITREELEQALKEKGMYDGQEIKDIIAEADADNTRRARNGNGGWVKALHRTVEGSHPQLLHLRGLLAHHLVSFLLASPRHRAIPRSETLQIFVKPLLFEQLRVVCLSFFDLHVENPIEHPSERSLGFTSLMLFFFIMSAFPFFLLLSKSLPLQPRPPWAGEVRLLSVLFWQELLSSLLHLLDKCKPISARKFDALSSVTTPPSKICGQRVENAEMSVLDLPELALECILGKLSPAGLSNMAAVCSSLRERCRSDHLWEKHMKEKWERVIGDAARRDWKLYLASREDSSAGIAGSNSSKKWVSVLSRVWHISLLKSRIDGGSKTKNPLPDDSIMSWYQSLESGKFWFPAQVYNRELKLLRVCDASLQHGHVGFMLSCYDAAVRYDCQTDTFHARYPEIGLIECELLISIIITCRYPPHGRRTTVMEEGVQRDRLRAPPVDTLARDLHISDCLNDLRPGDHIEIQWRRSKEFPYGGCFVIDLPSWL